MSRSRRRTIGHRDTEAPATRPDHGQYETDDSRQALDRLISLSDGVFAIGMTLLVFQIALPEVTSGTPTDSLMTRLLALRPEYLSFVISFLVIGTYWMSHRRIFQYIVRSDGVLVWLNMLLLLCIAFQPFPTRVMGNYDDQPTAIAFYAGTLAATGLLLLALWVYATTRHHLVRPDLSRRLIQHLTLRALIAPVVFIASVFIARAGTTAAELSWLSIAVLMRILRWIYRDAW